jgi:serine/threonine protein kinase
MNILTQVLYGVAYLRNAGLVHNNIKPESILVSFPYCGDPEQLKADIIDVDFATPIKYRQNDRTIIPELSFSGSFPYLPRKPFLTSHPI